MTDITNTLNPVCNFKGKKKLKDMHDCTFGMSKIDKYHRAGYDAEITLKLLHFSKVREA